MKTVMLITNIPTPYRIPLFNEISNLFGKNNLKFKVIFCSETYKRRKWKLDFENIAFEYSILKSLKISVGEWLFNFSLSLVNKLSKEKPDIIISGGFSIPTIMVWLYSRLYRIPFIIWSGETPELSVKRNQFWGVRNLLRKKLVHEAKSCIVYGKKAQSYLESLGKHKNLIFIAINTVDTRYFSERVEMLEARKEEIKMHEGFPGKNVLFVGYLYKRKGVDNLLQSISTLTRDDFALHIVGDGPERIELENLSKRLNLKKVYFWGYKQSSELPFFYSIADLLIFPSFDELWGLTINEAMACGLPVLCSNTSGAAEDLIRNGYNGFLIDPEDVKGMGEMVDSLLGKPEVIKKVGLRARKFIEQNTTLQHSAGGFLAAVKAVL
jgi:glycosyltransferase involved in cell wall biosynthesis